MTTFGTFEDWLRLKGLTESLSVWPPHYLSSPFLLDAQNHAPEGKGREAAWDIYIELRSRVTTQSLPLHSGREATTLKSLHSLFEQTRTTLHKHGAEASWVGEVALRALNEDLRPVTGYWHRVVGDGEFVYADEAGDFRADILHVQNQLRLLADFLGYAARGAAYHPERLVKERQRSTGRYSPEPLPATTAARALTELIAAEHQSIASRRAFVGMPDGNPALDATGVALSGGGIRSATFGVGVLTALSRAGLYHQFDYLSTVSGGGYTGTLISTWATAKAKEAQDKANKAAQRALREGPFCDDAATEHLRDRSRYLTEGGASGIARALLPICLGILASVSTVLLTTVVTLPLAWLGDACLDWVSSNPDPSLMALLALIVVAMLGTGSSLTKTYALAWGARALVGIAVLLAPTLAVRAVNATQSGITRIVEKASAIELPPEAFVAAVPFILTGLGTLLRRRRRTPRLALTLLAASPLLAYGIGLAWLSPLAGVPNLHSPDGYTIALGVALVVFLLSNVNEHSPLGYYRDRLAATYCVETSGAVVKALSQPPTMAELTDRAPIHLINATVNFPSTRARNDRGRGAGLIAFSRHGWTYPREKDGRIQHEHALEPPMELGIDLAMAISGGAVSPYLGTLTPAGASPWLTLLNLRLNAWLPNPGKRASPPWGYHLLRELLGTVGLNASRINVSDGGHFENLGAYELIRRRCRYIVAIDGEADPEFGCDSLINLIRLARIDFGVDIRIDPRKFKLNADRYSSAHLAVGKITYPEGAVGTLLYVKLSVTGDEPSHLLAYRTRESVFPHHSTADQIFDEEQFECYRALGQHVGEYLFRAELVGALAGQANAHSRNPGEPPVPMKEWIDAIERALDRNDPVQTQKA